MVYLDIVHNEYDTVLYLNGKSYQDIDYRWIDCLIFLKEILSDKVKIQERDIDKVREDFPETLENYKDAEPVWRRIDLKDIGYYLTKKTLKWENDDELFITEPTDELPDFIKFDVLNSGKWYVLED